MIKHLGHKTGKHLIFGGVYSNYQALLALAEVAKTNNIEPENIISTGDIVGYCAQPEECVQFIKEWGIHSILGNVEIQLKDGEEDCGCSFIPGSKCDGYSKEWFPYAQIHTSENSKNWFNTLPHHLHFSFGGKEVLVVHGSFHDTSEFIFKSTDWNIKQQNFNNTEADVILSGHCGLPFADIQNRKMWLNAGVIGMPANNGTPHVWYLIIDDDQGDFSYNFHVLSYDYETCYQLMKKHNLPEAYQKTILTGIWDNCEILPERETALQGMPIEDL